MIRLIQNEVAKVFKKKSMYIALALVLVCIIFVNCMNKFAGQNTGSYNFDSSIQRMEQELAKLDPKKSSDTAMYINMKTSVDEMKLMNQYGVNSWQSTVINEKIHQTILEINTYLYGTKKDESYYQKMKQTYDDYIQRLEKDDWRYFAQAELEDTQKKITENDTLRQEIVDKEELKTIEQTKKNLELEKKILEWRLEKDISYAQSDKNETLMTYQNYQQAVLSYENRQSEEYEDKLQYQKSKEKAAVAAYSIENDVITKYNDCRGTILNFFDSYGLIMIAIIIMIAGTIVSDEFNKGTIKLLLVKPYKRWKILLAKFITCLITMLLVIGIVFCMQLLVSGVLFGFDSLAIPEIHYNFNTNQVETMNVFASVGLTLLTQLPMYVISIAIAFMLSCVFSNSALSIVIALLGFMSTEIINMMSINLKLEFMKFFITPNWNLTPYLFGGLPDFQGLTMGFSVIINIAYVAILLGISFVAFQKKNIKNI